MSNIEFEGLLLTPEESFLAMYYFVLDYWHRGGRADGELTLFVHSIGPSIEPGQPGVVRTADPAAWSDWKRAVERARKDGYPNEL